MPSFGPQMALVAFMKIDRLRRHRHAGLGGVIGVVEADADELADLADAGADAGLTVHAAAACEGRQPRSRSRPRSRQDLARDVGDDAGEVADRAVLVEQAGFLLALWAVAQQLHGFLAPLSRLMRDEWLPGTGDLA